MSKTKNAITFRSVVKNVFSDLDDMTLTQYKRYMQWCIRGFNQLSMFHLNVSDTFVTTVDATLGTVNLPDDYIDYIRIGFLRGRTIHPLSKNNNLVIPYNEECGLEVNDTVATTSTEVRNWTWLAAPTKTYNIGFYREDKENNRLIMDGNFGDTKIVIDYITSGVKLDGETWVPKIAEESLIAFVHLQRATFDDPKMIPTFERRWDIEREKLEEFEWSFTMQEFLDVVNSSRSQTVK